MEASGTENSAKQFQLATNEAQDAPEKGGKEILTYSHLFNKRGAWNKRGGGTKVAKSLNVELGINEEGGIFGKN